MPVEISSTRRISAIRDIFKSAPFLGVKTIVLILVAVIFMILDQHWSLFQKWRTNVSQVTLPMQYLVNAPIQAAHDIAVNLSSKSELLEENERLRTREVLLQTQVQKLMALQQENNQLRELLKATPEVAGRVIMGRLLAVDLDPEFAQMIVDKGARDRIYVGQPVLDAYGVMGQVINVGAFTSKVLLITDRHSAIPVQDVRNGMRAIAIGTGEQNKLELINIPETSDIRKGDVFVASSLGFRFPVGYPVGQIMAMSHALGEPFAKITLTPTAHFDQTQLVLLAWPSNKIPISTVVKQQLAIPLVAQN